VLSSPLQQGSACGYNTGHTYTGGGAQFTGGDCTPAASSAEQRGTGVGELGMLARPHRLGRIRTVSVPRAQLTNNDCRRP
jgi:hypothetical protein